MKHLRLTLTMLTVFSIGYIDARATKKVGFKATQPAPAAPIIPTPPARTVPTTTPPAPSTPITQTGGSVKTFKQLFDQVKTMPANDVLNNNKNLLSDTFIANMIQEVKNAGLGELELTTLLLIARDKVPFTGNDAIDLSTLKNIKAQIENATTALGNQ